MLITYVIVRNEGGEVDRSFYRVTADEIAASLTQRTGVTHRVLPLRRHTIVV